MKFTAAVLAAGGSTRLGGAPKQLLRHRGETLVRRAVRMAVDAGAGSVLVITGHEHGQVAAELDGLPVQVVRNDRWPEGLSTSIALAVQNAAAFPLLILLCDQIAVTTEDVKMLTAAHGDGGRPITVSSFGGTVGPPAIFDPAIFPELLALRGDRGAKTVIEADPGRVTSVPMPSAAIDVDLPEDVRSIETAPD